MSKLPEITLVFWILKITATTLGETGGDWLSMTMNLGYFVSSLIFFGLFFTSLSAQLVSTQFRPVLYWTVIVATSTAGTTVSDYMNRSLGLGYAKGSALLITLLLSILGIWRYTVGNLSVNLIRTRKAELFYWFTILFSNTLGTSLGDFLSDESGLGFFGTWLCITGALAIIVCASRWTRLSKVFLFWAAFILTRPFGATLGDVLTKTHEQGGLDLGRGISSLILFGILGVTLIATREKMSPTGTR